MNIEKLVMAVSILFLLASCNQVKVAYVDVDEILKEYKGAKDAEKEIQAESIKLSAEIEQLTNRFQQKVQEFQKSSNTMSAAEKQKLEQELMMEQQQIQMSQQMVQQQMQALSLAKIEELDKDIELFLEAYAKSNGYSYILGTSQQTKAVMYGDASLNVTDEVLESLNSNYKTEEITEETTEINDEEVVEENPE